MTAIIDNEDRLQFDNASNTKLHYNNNDELIFISYELFDGRNMRQQVNDTSYTGSTAWEAVTARTLTFGVWNEQ